MMKKNKEVSESGDLEQEIKRALKDTFTNFHLKHTHTHAQVYLYIHSDTHVLLFLKSL